MIEQEVVIPVILHGIAQHLRRLEGHDRGGAGYGREGGGFY